MDRDTRVKSQTPQLKHMLIFAFRVFVLQGRDLSR